jgi:glycosyltransferase involved in cell wall biosynthesis
MYKHISDVAIILDAICDSVLIIDGNTQKIVRPSEKVTLVDIGISLHALKDIKPTFYSAILMLAKTVAVQPKLSLELVRRRHDVDVVLFYAANPHHLLPLVTAKILKKRTVEVVSVAKEATLQGKILEKQYPLFFRLLDGISPLSEALIKVHGLDKYPQKLLPDGFRFIDTSRFKVTKPLAERRNVIGFISRLKKEKGIVEFVKAIPLILEENTDTEFLIGGSGNLTGWVVKECAKIKESFGVDVTVTGWIGDDLPDYFNQLKLVVLPTYSEALGTALLEAMACGTPVLAPATGGIPDIVKDRETGFILPNIEPECIAKSVMKILACSDLEIQTVVENGIALVNDRYSYEAAVERYRGIVGKNGTNLRKSRADAYQSLRP